jgi:hypothetical protein
MRLNAQKRSDVVVIYYYFAQCVLGAAIWAQKRRRILHFLMQALANKTNFC